MAASIEALLSSVGHCKSLFRGQPGLTKKYKKIKIPSYTGVTEVIWYPQSTASPVVLPEAYMQAAASEQMAKAGLLTMYTKFVMRMLNQI